MAPYNSVEKQKAHDHKRDKTKKAERDKAWRKKRLAENKYCRQCYRELRPDLDGDGNACSFCLEVQNNWSRMNRKRR